jgi:hypothetical protein
MQDVEKERVSRARSKASGHGLYEQRKAPATQDVLTLYFVALLIDGKCMLVERLW